MALLSNGVDSSATGEIAFGQDIPIQTLLDQRKRRVCVRKLTTALESPKRKLAMEKKLPPCQEDTLHASAPPTSSEMDAGMLTSSGNIL